MEVINVSRQNAERSLDNLFSAGEEGILRLEPFRSVKNFIFDFDGVLLEECGVVESGYAWLLRAVRDGVWDTTDIYVSADDIEIAREFRPNIKGKSPIEKVVAYKRAFGNGRPLPMQLMEVVESWFSVVAGVIRNRFGEDSASYLLPGALKLVETACQRGSAFGLTANIQRQADFLMGFVGLSGYFNRIVGFPVDATSDMNKATMLEDLIESHGLDKSETCYIGDGAPDMKAANTAGIIAVAISNDLIGGKKLLSQDCHVVATSSICGDRLIDVLHSGH